MEWQHRFDGAGRGLGPQILFRCGGKQDRRGWLPLLGLSRSHARTGRQGNEPLRHAPRSPRGRLDLRVILRRAARRLETRRPLRRHRALRHRANERPGEVGSAAGLEPHSPHQRNCVLHPEFVDRQYAFYTRPMADFAATGSGDGIGWGLCDDISTRSLARNNH